MEREIGDGAFSKVYMVIHKATGQRYALKDMLLVDIHEDDIPNLESELCVHPFMENEYIIKFIDFFATQTNLYLFLDIADSGILFRFIDNGHPIDQNYIKKFFYQTCIALIYMHDMDLIHRDIKPENILLTRNFDIRVADFGWVTVSERFKHNKSMCGTPEYMAPEIIKGGKQTKAVDIWAMGILLYEMFHNDDCFKGDDHYQIYNAITKREIEWNENCPREAKDLIMKLLEFKPEDRICLEDALKHPYMIDYTSSIPYHSVDLSNKSSTTKVFTPLAAKIINKYTKSTKAPIIGHIDKDNMVYKSGSKPKNKKANVLETNPQTREPSKTVMSVRGEFGKHNSEGADQNITIDKKVIQKHIEENAIAIQKTREHFEELTKNTMLYIEEEPEVEQKDNRCVSPANDLKE